MDMIHAIHESSHFLAAYLNGAVIGSVTCVEGNSEFRSSHKGYTGNRVNHKHPDAKIACLMILAGAAGEKRLCGCLNLQGAEFDICDAISCLELKGWKEPAGYSDEKFYHDFSGDAERFVNHPLRWKMIELFAQELLKQRKTNGQNAVMFVQKEVDTWSAKDQLELFYPADGLGGLQLPLKEHCGLV